jgi:hypothetical protein
MWKKSAPQKGALIPLAAEASEARMTDNARKRIWLRVTVAVFTVAAVLFAAGSGYLTYQRWILDNNFRKLQVGDTKERVEKLLGKPRWRFAKGGQILDLARKQDVVFWLLLPESAETWVYGRWRLLWFAPEEDDYAIEFDNAGRVARTVVPRDAR